MLDSIEFSWGHRSVDQGALTIPMAWSPLKGLKEKTEVCMKSDRKIFGWLNYIRSFKVTRKIS